MNDSCISPRRLPAHAHFHYPRRPRGECFGSTTRLQNHSCHTFGEGDGGGILKHDDDGSDVEDSEDEEEDEEEDERGRGW